MKEAAKSYGWHLNFSGIAKNMERWMYHSFTFLE